MVNRECLDLVEAKPQNASTCFISYDRTMNSTVSPPIMAKEVEIDTSLVARRNKRVGRGAVNSGLTCECGVFAAMACGEWPTQKVSFDSIFQFFLNIFFFQIRAQVKFSEF